MATTILAGVEGATVGAGTAGVIGALIGYFVSKEHISKYEEHFEAGKLLLVAQGSIEEVRRAKVILDSTTNIETNDYP